MKNLFGICVLLLCSLCAIGQGNFLSGDKSGFGMEVSQLNNNMHQLTQVRAAFLIKGFLDLGIAMNSGDMPELLGFSNIKESGYTPYVNFHILKQDELFNPISFTIGASYNFLNLSNQTKAASLSALDRSYNLSGQVRRDVALNSSISIQPGINVVYGKSNIVQIREFGSDQKSNPLANQIGTNYQLGAQVPVIVDLKAMKFALTPSYAYTNFGSQIGMKFTTILAANKNASRCNGSGCMIW